MSMFSNRLVQFENGAWGYAEPERPQPKVLADHEVSDLKERVVDEWAGLLMRDYGIPRERANTLASRQRDRIEVQSTAAGVAVVFRDLLGAVRSAARDVDLSDMANQIEYRARLDAGRENPAPPPSVKEITERSRQQVAADLRHSI